MAQHNPPISAQNKLIHFATLCLDLFFVAFVRKSIFKPPKIFYKQCYASQELMIGFNNYKPNWWESTAIKIQRTPKNLLQFSQELLILIYNLRSKSPKDVE